MTAQLHVISCELIVSKNKRIDRLRSPFLKYTCRFAERCAGRKHIINQEYIQSCQRLGKCKTSSDIFFALLQGKIGLTWCLTRSYKHIIAQRYIQLATQ